MATEKASQNAPNKATSLLVLMKTIPRELRDQIYADTLRQDTDILITNYQLPPILLVCKQIRHEALPIFYSSNTFRYIITSAANTTPPFAWLRSLSPAARTSIKTLTIELSVRAEAHALVKAMVDHYQTMLSQPTQPDPTSASSQAPMLQEYAWEANFFHKMYENMGKLYRSGKLDLAKIRYETAPSNEAAAHYDKDWVVTLSEHRDNFLNGHWTGLEHL